MKVLLLLALAVSAYAAVPGSVSERETQYAAYSEYIYEYKGQVLSGLPEVSREYSGLKIKSDVRLQIHSQNRFLMKLKNIQLCKIQKELDDPQKQQEVQAEDCQEDQQIREIKQELEKRIEFYWTRGQINQISSRQSDPDWSVNIKRGVMQLLHVNLEGNTLSKNSPPKTKVQQAYYRVMEQSIDGECESIYSVKVHVSEPERKNNQIIPERDGLNVTKVRNFEKCNDRPTRNDTEILMGLVTRDSAKDKQHEQRILTQLSQVRYNITGNRKLFIIDSAIAEGKHVIGSLIDDKGEAATFVNQTLIKKQIREIPAPGDPEFILNLDQNDRKAQPQGLKFVFPEEKPREVIDKKTHNVECQAMSADHGLHGQIEQLLNNVVNGIDEYISEESLDQLQLLKEKLQGLNRAELCHCMNHFGQDLVNDNELNEKRRMVLEDLLPYLPSLHSVEILYRRIESRRISGRRASELVSQLAFQPRPDDQIVDTVLELCMSDAVSENEQLKQTCWLTFGSLVNKACKDGDRQRCPELKEERYMRALVAGIDRSRPEPEHRMCLKAIGNAGLNFQNKSYNLIEEVQKIVQDKLEDDTSTEIKSQAIYSLRRVSIRKPEEIRAMLIPILRDQDLHHEIRIAAFVIIMDTQPDHLTIQLLAQLLQKETSRQLGNFVYSYLKGLAESKIPGKKNVTMGAREALKMAKKWENGLEYSRSWHWELELLKKKVSNALNVNWISSPESAYGVGTSTKLSTKIFGRNFNWMEFGYRSEHMEELAQELVFKMRGVYPPIDKQFKDQRPKPQPLSSLELLMGDQSSDLKQLVKQIDTEVNITERHPKSERMRVSFYIKAFGQEIQYITLNKSDIQNILAGDSKALQDLEVHLSVNKPQIKYQKALNIGGGFQLWPTSLGIPLQLNLTSLGLVKLDAIGKAVMTPSLKDVLKMDDVNAKKLEMSGILSPRMGLITKGSLGVALNHQLKAGIAYEAVINSSVLINGSLKLDLEKLKLESKFQPPQHDHTVVSIKGKPFTYSLSGEKMPKKYRPGQSGQMLHMMMMTPEQIQAATNQERRREIKSTRPLVLKKSIGNRTVVAEAQVSFSPAKSPLLSGPANASIVLRPGQNRPEEIQVAGLISDWMVTPEQYEDHILRSSRRQHIEDPKYDSSQSGSRSFASVENIQDIRIPSEFLSSKELHMPTGIPESLEERREQENFSWETAHWTEEDLKTKPLSQINRIQDQQQQQQQQQPGQQQPRDCERFIPLKRVYLNITAKGQVPQSELLTAITLDTENYKYKALTVDVISETKRTEDQLRVESEHKQEVERLRNDPLNAQNQERLEILEALEEQRRQEKSDERMVLCVQGEVEMPDMWKLKSRSQGDIMPPQLDDDTKVKYRLGVQFGKTCENDKKLQILARIEKSKQQLIDESRSGLGQKSDVERLCEEDRRRGDMESWACQKVSEDRLSLRSLHLNITTKLDRKPRDMKSLVGERIVRLVESYGIVTRKEAINEQERIIISTEINSNRDQFNISVKAPLVNTKIEYPKLPIKLPSLYSPKEPMVLVLAEKILGQPKPRCAVSNLNKVVTFDNITYDYELSKCHHILAKDCSPAERFLVLGRKKDPSRQEKEVIIHLAGHKIEFKNDVVDGLQVLVDDINQQLQPMDKLEMREDGTMEKKNIMACQRRTLMDVIRPDITDNGINSAEVYRLLTHRSRHQTPRPQGQTTPRPAYQSDSQGAADSRPEGSKSVDLTSASSEEAKMNVVEKQTWTFLKSVMGMTFDGLDQREIMEMFRIDDQLRTEDGYLIDANQPSSPKLWKIFRTPRSVMLIDYRLGMVVSTCGETIKVEVSHHFKDQVCGLCGHYDGEFKTELRGPSEEVYRDAKQFALSYQLQSIPQQCTQECVPRSNIEKQDLNVDNVDSSCYSKVPIPRCRSSCNVAESKRVKTEFVCISRDSGLKTQLDDSIQRQRPHEVVRTLKSKSPSFIEEVEIHTRCQL